jgi:glycosyltransferase involved in cell wall biosynthesis
MSPLVSIITPAYNAEPYIAETLRSALSQTHSRLEVIVVNDGSSDGTLAIAKSFADPCVRVVDQPNLGAAAARNRGLREAQGDFIQFLDADDLLAPNKIAVQVQRLLDNPDCIATARWGRFRTNPSETRFVRETFWRDMPPLDWLVSRWERSSMMHPGGWLLPRSVLDKGGLWDESLSLDDDGEFFDRMVISAQAVLFCEEAVSFYRSSLSSSLSGTRSPVAWSSQFRALSLGANRLLRIEDSPRTRRACSRGFEEFVYGSYPAVPDMRTRAWNRVRELGGPYFRPQMGQRMNLVSHIVGWKLAKRLQKLSRLLKGSKA